MKKTFRELLVGEQFKYDTTIWLVLFVGNNKIFVRSTTGEETVYYRTSSNLVEVL